MSSKTNWTDQRLQRLFEHYNQIHWRGKLSGYRVVLTHLDCMGMCEWNKRLIEVDPDRHTSDRELRSTVLHEMSHAASKSGHTIPFFAQLERLIRQGAPITVSNSEAGTAKILSDVVPKQFPLLRTKMQHAEKHRARSLEKLIREKKLKTYTMTDEMILMEFKDAAMEVTWKKALHYFGPEYGLTDECGRPVNARARRLLIRAEKTFHASRREHLQYKKREAAISTSGEKSL
jgi:hypothetical protein